MRLGVREALLVPRSLLFRRHSLVDPGVVVVIAANGLRCGVRTGPPCSWWEQCTSCCITGSGILLLSHRLSAAAPGAKMRVATGRLSLSASA